MAILASLTGALGRFAGKLVNSALGWASILLFGRVPQSKQILLSIVTLGSLAWVVSVIGVLLPDVGAFLIAAIPAPKFIDRNLIRLAMLVVALVLPLVIGFLTTFLVVKDRRPKGRELLVTSIRGYVFAFVLAVVLLFLAGVALVRKVRAVTKRWEDAHVAIVLKPGGYDRLVRELSDALDAAGLQMRVEPAPKVLSTPAKLLGAAAGSSVKSLVPDRLAELKAGAVEVLVYPSDIAIQGTKEAVAKARAAIATRLTAAPAYMTTSEEAQKVEDRIEAASARIRDAHAAGAHEAAAAPVEDDLHSIDQRLASLTVDYDDWETLYRMRLQVERSLLTGEGPGQPTAGMRGDAPSRPERRGTQQPVDRSPSLRQRLAPVAGLTLVALDVVLAAAERVAPPSLRRRRAPWE